MKTSSVTNNFNFKNWYTGALIVGGIVGFVASLWQAAERVHMLKNPSLPLECNLNPIVNCGSVLDHKLSALFGFPNAFLGIFFFTFLLVSGVVLWANGEKLKKVFWQIQFVVNAILLGFALWFFSVSLYVIGNLCLFCIFVWLSAIAISWYGLWWHRANQTFGFLGKVPAPKKFKDWHLFGPIAIYLLMIALALIKFNDYYFG